MIISWQELSKVLNVGLHTLLYGPPGTGKTTAAVTADSYNITCTAEMPAAELRGHYIPEGSKFVFHDGPAIRAWREGKRLVLNEINEASGDALTFLYAILDDPRSARLTLPTGETVRPAPGFQAIATTNATDFDSMLPAALLDRFAVRVCVDEPHPDSLARLPEPLANMVKSTMELGSDRKVSLRQALAYESLRDALQGSDLAGKAVFGSRSIDVFNSILLAIASDSK